jgi:hypothetical protein
MLKLVCCLSLLFALLPKSLANPSDDIEAITREIYQRTGLDNNQVPFNHFEAAYLRYLQGKRDGELSDRPLISFVNFTTESGDRRYYLVDVSQTGARIIHETYVSHGQNSGTHVQATTFGNVNGSLKSSLGFYRVSEPYSGRHGRSLRLDGLSGSLNSNARSRAIVMHTGSYVTEDFARQNGYVGRSWGCFVIPYSVRDSLYSNIQNGTLLYAFYLDQGANFQGSRAGLADVANADTQSSGASVTRGDPEPSLSDSPRFSDASPSLAAQGQAGDHMELAPGTGVDGPDALDFDGDGEPDGFESDDPQINGRGDTPYRGNADHERCQSYADRPWNEVVERTQAGEDPHQFFRGSWLDVEREASMTDNITYGAEAAAARNHLGIVNECAALATVGDPQNFRMENPNAPTTVTSADGSITCQYIGPEAVDFTQCQQMVRAHNELMIAEQDLHRTQGEEFRQSGESAIAGLQGGINIQGNSALLAENLAANAAQSAAQRQQFQTARLDAMATELAAMPTYKSLLAKCHSKTSKFPQGALLDYQAYIQTIPDLKIPPTPDMGDACHRALSRLNIKYIQNKKAKDQAKKVLEKLGYKIEKLQEQETELIRQQQGFRDGAMKGPSLPDYKLKDLEKVTADKYGVIDMEMKSNFKPAPVGPKRDPAAKTSFSYPEFSASKSNSSRRSGLSQGLINPYQKDYQQQLQENTHTFLALLKEGNTNRLLAFMKENGLSLADIDYAAKNGVISTAQAEKLKEQLRDRLGQVVNRRQVSYDLEASAKPGNSEWQIEKDSTKSLFDIISHRYMKQEQLSR